MSQTTISVTIDTTDKSKFDNFCNDVGLSTTSAINLFVKAVIREHRIPFEISQSCDDFYSPTNMAFLREGIAQLNSGKGVAHELIEEED